MTTDKFDFNRVRPYYPTYFDKNMEFLQDRSFFLMLAVLLIGMSFAKPKILAEQARWFMWTRKEKYEEQPAHWFTNRGGVVMKKEVYGFEKYHRSNGDVMDWYAKAFPQIFED